MHLPGSQAGFNGSNSWRWDLGIAKKNLKGDFDKMPGLGITDLRESLVTWWFTSDVIC